MGRSTTGISAGTGLSPSVHEALCHQGHGSELPELGIMCIKSYLVGMGTKWEEWSLLTSLVDPERGAQVAVNSTLGCGHFYKDVDNTVISRFEVAAGELSGL